MADFRSLLHRLHASNLLAWEDMLSDIAREVREALADELAPVTTTTDGKPLPCPFCGSPDVDARTMPYVRCRTCVAFGPDATDDADGPALWNTRAALSDSTPSPRAGSAPESVGAGEGVSLTTALRILAAGGLPVELCYHPSADPGDGTGWVLVIGETHNYGGLDVLADHAVTRAGEVSDG